MGFSETAATLKGYRFSGVLSITTSGTGAERVTTYGVV